MKKIPKKKAFVTVIAISLIIAAVVSVLAFMNTKKNNKNTSSDTVSTVEKTKEKDSSSIYDAKKVTLLTVKQAKKKALKESKKGQVIGYERDVEYGKPVFEIIILDGKNEKEIKIDRRTGKVLKVETKDLSLDVEDKLLINAKPKIDLSKAERKVKAKYPKTTIKKLKLEVDDNVLVYELSVVKGNKEIEAELDANTGIFTQEEIETEDDQTTNIQNLGRKFFRSRFCV